MGDQGELRSPGKLKHAPPMRPKRLEVAKLHLHTLPIKARFPVSAPCTAFKGMDRSKVASLP